MKQKKNKTNQVVTWPTATLFTIQELHRLNPKFVNITLRVRLTKAIEAGKVAEIGSIPGEKGRPQKVFAFTPVTQATFDKAFKEGITPVDNYKSLISMVSVTTNSTPNSSINPMASPATVAA
jgi:hypothetical protein